MIDAREIVYQNVSMVKTHIHSPKLDEIVAVVGRGGMFSTTITFQQRTPCTWAVTHLGGTVFISRCRREAIHAWASTVEEERGNQAAWNGMPPEPCASESYLAGYWGATERQAALVRDMRDYPEYWGEY